MINHIVTAERVRLKKLGYDSFVTPVTVTIEDAMTTILLSNDTYILTGIRISDADMKSDTNIISITSPTDCIEGTARQLSEMGTSILHLFKDYIIVKTVDESGYFGDNKVDNFKLEFVQISPVKMPESTTLKR